MSANQNAKPFKIVACHVPADTTVRVRPTEIPVPRHESRWMEFSKEHPNGKLHTIVPQVSKDKATGNVQFKQIGYYTTKI